MPSRPSSTHSLNVSNLLDKFRDTMHDVLHDVLPPLRDIQHVIDLVLGLQLSNIPHYIMNLVERDELNRQLKGLLEKEFIHHSLNPCIVPILLILRKILENMCR